MTTVPRRLDHRKRVLGFVAAAAVVVVLAVLLANSHNKNQAPFTGVQAHAKLVGLQVLSPSDASGSNIRTALEALGGATSNDIVVPSGHRDWQYVVGRVDVAREPASSARYDVIVVDNRLHQVPHLTFSYPADDASKAAQGWDQADSSLAKAYHFTTGNDPQAASFAAGAATSLPFFARLDPSASPVTDDHRDLTVVLALSSGDHVYWSEKLN